MSQTSWTSSASYQLIFLTIFILAFFPGAFQYILKLPFRPFTSSPSQKSSTVACPAHCLFSDSTITTITTTTTTPGPTENTMTSWFQKSFSLSPRSRGSYLITSEVVAALPEISAYRVGLLHLFVQHTSCALSLNENCDGDVREDMSDALDRIAPEDDKGDLYRHADEGRDDMPAHIKSSLIGSSVTIPITNGKLATGTWQGIWYLEFRARKHNRNLVATIQGEKR